MKYARKGDDPIKKPFWEAKNDSKVYFLKVTPEN